MKCWICHKEMENTIGGCYHCNDCGVGVDDLVLRLPIKSTENNKNAETISKIKIPDDLIKATDWNKQQHRVIHEFEYKNGKYIQHYTLGGEHELTPQEVVDCLNALTTIDCDLQTAYTYIHEQAEKQNQKAIECLKVVRKLVDGRTYLAEFIDNKIKELQKEKQE